MGQTKQFDNCNIYAYSCGTRINCELHDCRLSLFTVDLSITQDRPYMPANGKDPLAGFYGTWKIQSIIGGGAHGRSQTFHLQRPALHRHEL